MRYADDFVIMCGSPKTPQRLGAGVEWTAEAGLNLHPTKTKIIDAAKGPLIFWAIGSEGQHASRVPRARRKIKDTLRAKTKRTIGEEHEEDH